MRTLRTWFHNALIKIRLPEINNNNNNNGLLHILRQPVLLSVVDEIVDDLSVYSGIFNAVPETIVTGTLYIDIFGLT